MKRTAGLALVLIVLVAGVGCSGEDAGREAALVRRDSAGVEIVENPAQAAARALDWRIDSVPAVDIGQVQGDPAYELFRVTGAGVLPDGRMVVINSGTQELRFYDERGRFLHAAGRSGQGPGEYQFPFLLPSPSYDTLHIFDRNAGLSFVALDGTFVRGWQAHDRIGRPIGMMSPDRLITRQGSATAGANTPEGIMRDDVVYETVDLATVARDTVGQFRGQALRLSRFDLGGGRLSLAFTAVPLDVAPSEFVAPGRLVVAPGKVPDVLVHDSTGTLRRIVRVLEPTVQVTREDFDRAVDAVVASASSEEQATQLRQRHEGMPVPDTMPVFRRVLIDALGCIWAERFDPVSNRRHVWVVSDSTGVVLGHIETPGGVTVHQIGRDFILGHTRDALDIEHVVRYTLVRSQ